MKTDVKMGFNIPKPISFFFTIFIKKPDCTKVFVIHSLQVVVAVCIFCISELGSKSSDTIYNCSEKILTEEPS